MESIYPHINIFIAYAIEDEPILKRLQAQLSILERNKEVRVWHDGMVHPSQVRAKETNKAIEEAQVILLLVSADFLASDKCYENHLQKALQKHKEGTAQVIPIIVRPCLWEETDFSHIAVLSLAGGSIRNLIWAEDGKIQEKFYKEVASAVYEQVKDFQLTYQLQDRQSPKNNVFVATQLQKDLKKYVAKDNLEEAMGALSSLENLEKGLKDSIDLLNSRFLLWKQYKNSQLDTPDNLKVRQELILQALHLLIDQLPANAQLPKRKRSLFSFLPFSQNNTATETNVYAQEKDKIRDYLIERYTERFRQKTDHRLPVSLQLTYTKEGTSSDYAHFSKDIRLSESIEGTLTQTLQKHQHLLIIGNPGAGKTTQILELAREWLTEQVDEKLPIVFNLASWKPNDDRFHEWLQNALVSGYGFSKKLAQEAILTNQILPLLDGLDEVGKDLESEAEQHNIRNACLQAIDDYLGLWEVEYVVICSRRKEYSEIEVNAPVKAEVLVNPLTPEQIKATLKDSLTQKLSTKDENAANVLLQLLKENPVLEEVLCTPFYYNIALEVFDSRSSNQDLPTTKAELEEYLVEQFIEEKLRDTPNQKGFLKEKTLDYLGWIGGMMNGEGKVVFELVDLQPRHLKREYLIRLLGSLFVGLICGLIFGFDISLMHGSFFGLNRGLFVSITIGLLMFNFAFKEIIPKEVRQFRWRNIFFFFKVKTYKNILKSIILGVSIGTLAGFIIGLTHNFFILIYINMDERYFYEAISLKELFNDILTGTVIGILSGCLAGLMIGLSLIFFRAEFSPIIKNPYFRLKYDFLFVFIERLFVIIISIVLSCHILAPIKNWEGLTYFVHVGLYIAMPIGLFVNSMFNHLILRLCLFLEKKLPLQLVHFLQYTTQARILEQDGGQWRFRHQILQDYFAERYGKKL